MIIRAITFAQMNPSERRLISCLIWMVNSLLVVAFALAVVLRRPRGVVLPRNLHRLRRRRLGDDADGTVPQHMLSRGQPRLVRGLGLTPFGLPPQAVSNARARPDIAGGW
jgi:hypothetical protein